MKKVVFSTLLLLAGVAFGMGIAVSQAATYQGECVGVAVYDTSTISPPSPDPSGLEYLPWLDQFISSDGEVEETANGVTWYEGVNVWQLTLDSSRDDPILVDDVFETTSTAPNPPSFSNEPVGLAVDPVTRKLYIADDNKDRIYIVEPKADGLYGTADDVVKYVSTRTYGANDPEGLAIGGGFLWLADSSYGEVYKLSMDAKVKHAQFDTKYPGGTTVKALPYSDGIGFHPNGLLYLVGPSPDTTLFEFSQAGVLLRKLDIRGINNGGNGTSMSGVAIGPATDAPGVNVFISERGVDNGASSASNDGKIYECRLDP